jgi:3-hydroxyacyl-[acyl-carrier-protein] dehydratase
MTAMDIKEITEYLPHRFPFLLVDRVIDVKPGEYIKAIKNVSYNESFFQGHFPKHPVMPGVLVIEALAQAAAILTFKTEGVKPGDKLVTYFVGIDKARFRIPVFPGDQLELHAKLMRHSYRFWKFAVEGIVNGQVVAEAELLCTEKNLDE